MSGPVVVAQGWLGDTDGHRIELEGGWHMGSIAAAAIGFGARTAYVLDRHMGSTIYQLEPGAPVPDGWTVEWADGGWRGAAATTTQGIACMPGGQAVSLGTPPVQVVRLDKDEAGAAGPWYGMGAAELLRAFGALEKLLGVPWGSSVGRTAQALILASHPPSRGGQQLDTEPDMPEPVQGSSLELPWSGWSRDLTAAEECRRFVHAFDANAQYLAAWQAAELGHGQPRLVARPRFDKTAAAVWHIPDAKHLRNVNSLLPAPWLDGREWFMTPTVQRMLEVCDGLEAPEIVEAYVWPSHSRFLRGAGERLRDARADAMEAHRLAVLALPLARDGEVADLLGRAVAAEAVLEAVKSIYRVQTGRFGMEARAGSPWGRPDWGHTVRATARCNLHRRLCKLTEAPMAIATDGLLFLSDEPDGAAFAKRIGLPLGRGLGEYRHDATAAAGAIADRASVPAMFRAIYEEAL